MTFELSDTQLKKYYEWRNNLPKLPQDYFGAAGGGYWFKFIPTGLGTIVTAGRDDGHELELTEWQYF